MSKIHKISMRSGETKTLWKGVFVGGKIFYQIRNLDRSEGTINAWWIVKLGILGIGRNKNIGTLRGMGELEIPSFSAWVELRGRAHQDVKMAMSDSVVAHEIINIDF